jgi:hypothetical protein
VGRAASGIVGGVFWPLIGGFIAFVVLTALIGRFVGGPSRDEHEQRH